jgi:exodeoxyribonuclease VII small subunit
MNKIPSYSEAFRELQEIVSEIETGEVSVDELSLKVKRASELIRLCREKLANTEEDVNKILKELENAAKEE